MSKRFIPALLGILLAVLALGAASAAAETLSPWWHLTSSARPTNISTKLPATTVDELTASGPAGGIFVVAAGSNAEAQNIVEGKQGPAFAILEFGVEGAVVQQGLESVYGKGNVEVTERVVGMARLGLEPYLVTFKGARAYQPVKMGAAVAESGTATVTQLTEGGNDGDLFVTAANLGDADVNGRIPVVLTDTLPAGLRAVGAAGVESNPVSSNASPSIPCSVVSEKVVSCESTGSLRPYDAIEVHIPVVAEPGAKECEPRELEACEVNGVGVTGGGAPSTHTTHPVVINKSPASFGVEQYELTNENVGGSPDTQAGSHPFQTTTTFEFNTSSTSSFEVEASGKNEIDYRAGVPALAKDLRFKWPPGLIGNPQALPTCTLSQFLTATNGFNECPEQSVVGVAVVAAFDPTFTGLLRLVPLPLFNLEPKAGEPARLGFLPEGIPVFIDPAIRNGEDYGVTVHVENITQAISFLSSQVTVWGVPGAASHNDVRGNGCMEEIDGRKPQEHPCEPEHVKSPPPFLSLPTSCTGPLVTSLESDAWEQPGVFTAPVGEPMPALDGCNRLPFEPSIETKPDAPDSSTSTGLTVNVKVPQERSLNAEGLGEADLRNTTVALPAGIAINPSGGDGLEACSDALIGYEPERSSPPEELDFLPYLPGSIGAKEAGDNASFEPGINFCSNASKIGTARIKTPVLPNELTGAVYLAPQESNPFGSLVAMYIVVEDPTAGVLLKLPGEVQLCKGAGEVIDGMTCRGSGQIVTTFRNTPQAPAEEVELHFFGGEKASLATPARCGAYTTSTSITPWSARENPNPNEIANPSSTFDITAGPSGGPCPGSPLPFHPTTTGGATNIQAGAFSPLTVSMSRSDGEQNLKSIEAKLPPGLSGILTGVELCPEPQANLGECGSNSLIGEATVSVGVGGHPYTVSGGRFYLTGPYNGTGGCTVGTTGCAPFGLTFEVPAKAGPYDLANTKNNHPACDCVLVRGKIEINPETAAITITSDPPGSPDSIPTSIEGIPLEIQHVNATTTRGDFQFNPTNCSKMELVGNLQLSEGGSSTISTPFQVTNCAALKFEPKFSVSTSGKTSKAYGASLTAKVIYPNVPQGTDADIAKVKVELPKQLPSRLTTLQRACTAKQFEANPANCPSESKIGYAVVHTPLVPVPLEGPAIFVSHGGEAFPSLTMVLQGYGVTIELVGSTFISKSGVTSTTFKTVPDQPFSSFSLTLPEGKFSALAANGNLCKPTKTVTVKKKVTVKVHGRKRTVTRSVKQTVAEPLTMPTEFVAQNGAELKQDTHISVTGCPKAKPAKKPAKKPKAKKKK